jgi:predicted secreted protein
MASGAIAGIGTQLKRGDGATPTETFTTVAEILNISGPDLSLDLIDVTNMDSPSYYREVLPGFKSAGEIKFDINFMPVNSTHNPTSGILADFDGRVKRNWKLVFPDTGATTWSFAGYLTGFSVTSNFDDRLQASVTISITGAPTLT